jgi:outer membrane protein assembly factor BamB
LTILRVSNTPFRSRLALLRAVLLVVAALAARNALAASDPFEGLWLGTAGSVRERIEVGLDFRRNEAGELRLFLTQPVMNYFGAELGAVHREGDRVSLDEMGLALALKDGKLEGTFPGPNSPATFARASALPVELTPPAVPGLAAPRWSTRLGGQIYASPAVADGFTYVGTTGGVFNAVRIADGALAWTFSAGRPIFGRALVEGDAVYFVCDSGQLFKLNRADGKELWRYELGDGAVARVLPHPNVFDWDWQGPQPVIAGDVLFVGAGDGGFHAVDVATGARRWRFTTGGKIRNAALVDGARVILGGADKIVYALERATGKELWRHVTEAEIDAAPVSHDGKILVGNRGGGLYALSAATGERLWRTYFWGSWVESTPVVVDGVIYIGASDLRRVSAIDPADGRVIWRSDVFGWSWGTPLVVGDRIDAGAAGGSPYILHHVAGFAELDRASGRLLRRTPLPEVAGAHQWGIAGSPVLAGDTIVVSTIEGALTAYPLR